MDTTHAHHQPRFATPVDLNAMRDAGIVGPRGKYLHLGYAFGERLSLMKAVSVEIIAPPATGKTSRFVIPGILSTDRCCFAIHDPKGELWETCAGWSAQVGGAYRLRWDALDSAAQGQRDPAFNFIAPRIVPDNEPERRIFIDSVSRTLIEGTLRSDGDYFDARARLALSALIEYLIALVNHDSRKVTDGLAARWEGQPASLPMLAHWMGQAQERQHDEAERSADPDPHSATEWIYAVAEAAQHEPVPRSSAMELEHIARMAPVERRHILDRVREALAVFTRESVVQRTANSDFWPAQLSGRLSADALDELGIETTPASVEEWGVVERLIRSEMWEPVAVYVGARNGADHELAMLTRLFFEVCSHKLISHAPGEMGTSGERYGELPTCFMIDGLPNTNAWNAIVDTIDLGRSKERFCVLVAQSVEEIERTCSKEGARTARVGCAVRVVLAQNDREYIAEIIASVQGAEPSAPLLDTQRIAAMPRDRHLLLAQSFQAQPIDCDSCMYYLEPQMLLRAANPRTGPETHRYPIPAPMPTPGERAGYAAHEARTS